MKGWDCSHYLLWYCCGSALATLFMDWVTAAEVTVSVGPKSLESAELCSELMQVFAYTCCYLALVPVSFQFQIDIYFLNSTLNIFVLNENLRTASPRMFSLLHYNLANFFLSKSLESKAFYKSQLIKGGKQYLNHCMEINKHIWFFSNLVKIYK